MKFFENESGVAYGLIMMFIALTIGIFAWMFVGILMDHLEVTYNSLSDMYSDTMSDTVTDTVNSYSYLPAFFLIAAVIYLIVRSLRRDSEVA